MKRTVKKNVVNTVVGYEVFSRYTGYYDSDAHSEGAYSTREKAEEALKNLYAENTDEDYEFGLEVTTMTFFDDGTMSIDKEWEDYEGEEEKEEKPTGKAPKSPADLFFADAKHMDTDKLGDLFAMLSGL